MQIQRIVFALIGIFFGQLALAGESTESSLPADLQSLKQDVLQLNQELSRLEKELMFPSTEVALLISIDVGSSVRLIDVNLSIDGKNVGYHFYSDQEFSALSKGGIHRMYSGNLPSGKHDLKIVVTGYDGNGKDYQKTLTQPFIKGADRKIIELHAAEDATRKQHEFQFKEWDNG